MQNVSNKSKPRLSKFGFWDVDMSKLDYDKYAQFVIIRVMERGNDKDVEEIIAYYGQEMIIEMLTNAPSLMVTAIEGGKLYFNLKDEDFACYTKTPRSKYYSRS
jgi:hypothetical protein